MAECSKGTILGEGNAVDLEKELKDSNARIMALNTGNILDSVSGQVQIGRRQEFFWLAITVIVAGVLVVTSVFGRKKRRRR